jgi:hypothetical protein
MEKFNHVYLKKWSLGEKITKPKFLIYIFQEMEFLGLKSILLEKEKYSHVKY